MPVPDFFLIGAPKCGTSALFQALRQHPDIYMPSVKEPHFYAVGPDRPIRRPPRPRRGLGKRAPISDPSAYRALFSEANGHRAVGEASTSYLRSRIAPMRISQEVPDAKLIAVLRHPVERAHSSYWFYVSRCVERAPSFEDALAREWSGSRFTSANHFEPGLYYTQLVSWLSLFGREQIRIHLYEDWCERPDEVLRDLYTFLGVHPGFSPVRRRSPATVAPRHARLHRLNHTLWLPGLDSWDRKHNLGPPPAMRPDTRLLLHERYRADIERLQTLLGRDLSGWLDPDRPARLGRSSGPVGSWPAAPGPWRPASETYRHCGLVVASELALPGVDRTDSGSAPPDIRISLGSVPEGETDEVLVEADVCRFSVPGVGRYEVRSGREITVWPATGLTPKLSAFVLGMAWGVLMYQRGTLALHAGAVVIDGRAVAFCGPSTAGKSTCAAWFAHRGHPLVSDDLCRLDVEPGRPPHVWAASSRLKLSPQALRVGNWATSDPFPQPPDWKHHVPTEGWDGGRALALRGVYLLAWGEPRIQRLQGISALQRFHSEALYRSDLIAERALAPRWQQCMEIVRQVPVWEVRRPRGWSQLDQGMTDLARHQGWSLD